MSRLVTRVATVFVLACAVGAPAAAQTAKRLLSLDDLARVREVSDPQRSPDGKWVAYVVRSSDVARDRRDADIWMVSWDGREQVRLTSSPDDETTPRWSPDGRYLAFLSKREVPDEGKTDKEESRTQVWRLNRAGGEAEQLTDVKGEVSDFAWSPDSARLVLEVEDADPAAQPEKLEGWKRKTKPPIVVDRYHFKQDRTGYLRHLYSHLYVFDVATRKAEQITAGNQDDTSPAWSPDGASIAFVSKRGPDPDRDVDSNIFVVEARAGATPRQLTTFAGSDTGRPAWSPDGAWIAYLQGDLARHFAYDLEKLAVVPSAGGEARVLTAALDRSVRTPEWSADGTSVVVAVEDDRTVYLGRVPVAGTGRVEPLTAGRRVVGEFSGGPDGHWAVAVATAAEPHEIHALEKGALRRLTHHNDAWLAEVGLGAVEDVTFTAKDGTEVNGLLVTPPGYVAGRTYPALLNIHGGPDGQDEHAFDFEREFLAANGYVVLHVNYRGSSGRGGVHQKAIFGDWGHLEVVDLLAGADHVVARGIADPDRLGIGGWSYGGILTNYTIATDPRFKAAVSGASSSLQTSMYGVDQYVVQYEHELGLPWKDPAPWLKVSYPFFKADRITTPTLFLCGQSDFNVPVVGVEQMYQALKTLRVDTQLVVYPDQFHSLVKPSYQRDRLERYVAWYDKYLKGTAARTQSGK
jgi:dipeptidyl aminopeptidase/acylaminoacyl peptidase